ncbi:NAD-dependent epimerase/dehydratase family protein, partial [Cytophagia bacterium CHB2]|nr:NAD-dependent epimerase/dehydratase family protein [Cytophagia bacterium CHB2]
MKILITGSTGLIGSALIQALRAEGHHLVRLIRTPIT